MKVFTRLDTTTVRWGDAVEGRTFRFETAAGIFDIREESDGHVTLSGHEPLTIRPLVSNQVQIEAAAKTHQKGRI